MAKMDDKTPSENDAAGSGFPSTMGDVPKQQLLELALAHLSWQDMKTLLMTENLKLTEENKKYEKELHELKLRMKTHEEIAKQVSEVWDVLPQITRLLRGANYDCGKQYLDFDGYAHSVSADTEVTETDSKNTSDTPREPLGQSPKTVGNINIELMHVGCASVEHLLKMDMPQQRKFDIALARLVDWTLTRRANAEELHSGKLAGRLRSLLQRFGVEYADGEEEVHRVKNNNIKNTKLPYMARLQGLTCDRRFHAWRCGNHQNLEAMLAAQTLCSLVSWRESASEFWSELMGEDHFKISGD